MAFSLTLFGGALLERDGSPVTGRAAHKRRLALLALVAAARGRPVSRDRLIGYLWAEHSTDSARHLLSESLYVLRKDLGDETFTMVGNDVALGRECAFCDMVEFEDAVKEGDLERAVSLYRGPFLEGLYVADAPEFERWSEEERDRLARAFGRALETLAEAAEARGDALGAAEWWRRVAQQDPHNSRVALRLMQALESAGERAAALRHAVVHAALLREDFEAEPDPEVAAFAERVRDAPARSPAPRPVHISNAASEAATPRMEAKGRPVHEKIEPSLERKSLPPFLHRHRSRLTLLALATVSIAGAALALSRGAAADLDASTYIVLPFAQLVGGETAELTSDDCELLLYESLAQWNDLKLVDRQRTRDALDRLGRPSSLRAARRVARSLGAGKLVWGDLRSIHGTLHLEATLYDVERGRLLESHTVQISRGTRDVEARFRELAAALLTRGAPGEAAGTASFPALQAYLAGRSALDQWQLAQATERFSQAARLDPGFAAAHLWLAQALAWNRVNPVEWREPARQAVSREAGLSVRDRRLARGLLALAEARFPAACLEYDALLSRDSTDFAGWYGVGDCNARDPVVVRDLSTASGWRFRGSYQRAIEAYTRALRTLPLSHRAFAGAGFDRLVTMFRSEPRDLRGGYATTPDTVRFLAYPSLVGDTLAFIPYPASDFEALRPETLPPTRVDAAKRNRRAVREIAASWVKAFPRSVDAHEALALALEGLGELGPGLVQQGQPHALNEIALARSSAQDPDQRLRLAITDARLRVKLGDWKRARVLADSLLDAVGEPESHDAQRLAPLAALTGRLERLRELLRISVPEQVSSPGGARHLDVPPAVALESQNVTAYDLFGLDQRAAAAEGRLEDLLRVWVEPGEREDVRSALLRDARRLGLAIPARRVARRPIRTPSQFMRVQQRLASSDTVGARAVLDTLARARGPRRPGDVAVDFAFPQAGVHLALGDTAAAERELDLALAALPTLSRQLLDRVPETAALVRAMLLRAKLAALRGDGATAQRWLVAVEALWSDADPELRTAVREVRANIERGIRR